MKKQKVPDITVPISPAPKAPKVLLAGNFMLKTPIKAKYSDAVIYTSETFEQYPDIRLSDLSFKKSIQLTHGEEQQANLNWGTAELVSWISLDGTPLEGVVYKPENFDPNKNTPPCCSAKVVRKAP